ncbi:MAG: hypothetical protein GX826_05670 [Gammaproteobacteria bacterium]|jgi:hypothetical protein|nr:hypothetical protein [Gammaproteobacteria bacterium]
MDAIMTLRLLLSSFLLVLGFSAQASMDNVRSASGDSGAGCPPANPVTAAEDELIKPEPASTMPGKPVTPQTAPSPSTTRPGLRWHSFLPGMMK